jgi:hypothetical protein
LVSILVSANAIAGSSGAASPTAASVNVSRREMLDADNGTDDAYVLPVTLMVKGMRSPFKVSDGDLWRSH